MIIFGRGSRTVVLEPVIFLFDGVIFMSLKNSLLGLVLAGALTLLVGCASGPATENELVYWTADSQVAQDLKQYVSEVTTPGSASFVPAADRIAVFDFDGTLFGETYPSYFDWCMFVHRVLHDNNYQATAEMKKFAKTLEQAFKVGKLPKDAEKIHARYSSLTFRGMTISELQDYARAYMLTKAEGFNNLRRGEAYFKPMVSLFKYLQSHDFDVYICSGTERNIVRVLVDGVLDIPPAKVIGSDIRLAGRDHMDVDGLDYVFQPGEELVYTGELILKDVKANKPMMIAREIGKYPLLAFGNSSGDLSMAQYTVSNPKYAARAYILLGNDSQREKGSEEKVAKLKQYCDEHGFRTISMKDDFATVYGDHVTRTK